MTTCRKYHCFPFNTGAPPSENVKPSIYGTDIERELLVNRVNLKRQLSDKYTTSKMCPLRTVKDPLKKINNKKHMSMRFPLCFTFRETFLPNVTSPDTVRWSSSSMSGILSKRVRYSWTWEGERQTQRKTECKQERERGRHTAWDRETDRAWETQRDRQNTVSETEEADTECERQTKHETQIEVSTERQTVHEKERERDRGVEFGYKIRYGSWVLCVYVSSYIMFCVTISLVISAEVWGLLSDHVHYPEVVRDRSLICLKI